MNPRDLKLTDLDYATADHHLQMLKAALPYMEVPQQRTLSIFVRLRELFRTMDFFKEHDVGMMSICSLDHQQTSVIDMLNAVKPYGNTKEQELIELISGVLANRQGKQNRNHFSLEQIISIMPPEQQSRFETIQLMMQAMNQN